MFLVFSLFISCVIFDYWCVLFTQSIQKQHSLSAVLYSGALSSLALFTNWWGLRDLEYAPFIVCGHMVGCWIAMRSCGKQVS